MWFEQYKMFVRLLAQTMCLCLSIPKAKAITIWILCLYHVTLTSSTFIDHAFLPSFWIAKRNVIIFIHFRWRWEIQVLNVSFQNIRKFHLTYKSLSLTFSFILHEYLFIPTFYCCWHGHYLPCHMLLWIFWCKHLAMPKHCANNNNKKKKKKL